VGSWSELQNAAARWGLGPSSGDSEYVELRLNEQTLKISANNLRWGKRCELQGVCEGCSGDCWLRLGGEGVGTRWSRREEGLPSLGGVVNVSDVGKVACELIRRFIAERWGYRALLHPKSFGREECSKVLIGFGKSLRHLYNKQSRCSVRMERRSRELWLR